MSLVENLEFENRNIRAQDPALTTYSVAHLADGEVRLQLQSYGRPDRVSTASASQTMQFTRESALQLMDIIRQVFLLEE